MKKYLLIFYFIIFYCGGYSQKIDIIKVSENICDCLKLRNYKSDSTLIYNCYLAAYKKMEDFPKTKNKKLKMDIEIKKYLNANCPKYRMIISDEKGDWELLKRRPDSKLDKTTCRELFNYNILYYLESSGDSTFVTFKDKFWMESIQQGKYFSKCRMSWDTDCEFTLTFIESNEPYRIKHNKKRAQFHYTIVEKTSTNFVLLNNTTDETWQFKLYYKN